MPNYLLSTKKMVEGLSGESYRWLLYTIEDSCNDRKLGPFVDNPDAANLLRFICAPDILLALNRSRFANLMHCIVPQDLFLVKELDRYLQGLLIANAKAVNYKPDDLTALKYYDYLLVEQIPKLKNYIQEGKNQREIFDLLADIYKTIACLYQYKRNNNVFKFKSDFVSLKRIRSNLIIYKGIRNDRNIDTKELVYSIFISSILMCMIFDQDGINIEEVIQWQK